MMAEATETEETITDDDRLMVAHLAACRVIRDEWGVRQSQALRVKWRADDLLAGLRALVDYQDFERRLWRLAPSPAFQTVHAALALAAQEARTAEGELLIVNGREWDEACARMDAIPCPQFSPGSWYTQPIDLGIDLGPATGGRQRPRRPRKAKSA